MRDGFFILICIEKMYNHATQGVDLYTATPTTPSRVPKITLIVVFLVWSMFIFWLLRVILKVKDDWKALKFRILKHAGLSFLFLSALILLQIVSGGLQETKSGVRWFFVLIFATFIVFGGLFFFINRQWILSKMEISPTKKNRFALGLTIFTPPMLYLLFAFLVFVRAYSSLPAY